MVFHVCAHRLYSSLESRLQSRIVARHNGDGAGSVGYVVLDEADKMLSLGFKTQLDQVWGHIVGPHKDTPSDAPTQRPQVTLIQSSKLHASREVTVSADSRHILS